MRERRYRLHVNGVFDALTTSQTTLTSTSLSSVDAAIDEINSEANNSDDMNERLAVLNKGQILMARIAATQLQTMNELLRLNAVEKLENMRPFIPNDVLFEKTNRE